MKYINNWRKFLIESEQSSVFSHNVKFLKDSIEEIFDNSRLDDSLKIVLEYTEPEEIVSKLPPLKNNKIKSIAGSGTKGIVFNLDNSHVLKLYIGGYLKGEKEQDFYQRSKDRTFSGEADRTTLPIYDSGEVIFNYVVSRDDVDGNPYNTSYRSKVSYVEMAKLDIVNKAFNFLDENSQEEFDDMLENLINNVYFYLISTPDDIIYNNEFRGGKDLYRYLLQDSDDYKTPEAFGDLLKTLRKFKDKKNNKLVYVYEENYSDIKDDAKTILDYGSSIPKEYLENYVNNLFKTVEEYISNNGLTSSIDLISGNIGIDPTSPIGNPKFIYFDP